MDELRTRQLSSRVGVGMPIPRADMSDVAFPPTVFPAPTPGEALRLLTEAVQRLSLAGAVEEVQGVVRTAARRLTGADGATFVLREGGNCCYADEDAIEPLWKGKRFPLQACISGWAMLNRQAAVIEDIYSDARIPHEAYRPTFVKSLVMVPIRTLDPVGAIGIYWAHRHHASDDEIGLARALADSTAVALENVRAAQDNARLAREVQEHARAEEGWRELSHTDALTGLPNLRGWDQRLAATLSPDLEPVYVALLDLDDFKAYNDRYGHPAGDEFLRQVAKAWSAQLRPGDMLARLGGEEFAILVNGCDVDAAIAVAQRLRRATLDDETASIGLARWDGRESATQLVSRADRSLYDAKQAGRDRVAFSGF